MKNQKENESLNYEPEDVSEKKLREEIWDMAEGAEVYEDEDPTELFPSRVYHEPFFDSTDWRQHQGRWISRPPPEEGGVQDERSFVDVIREDFE
jgi:hypothetical protein